MNQLRASSLPVAEYRKSLKFCYETCARFLYNRNLPELKEVLVTAISEKIYDKFRKNKTELYFITGQLITPGQEYNTNARHLAVCLATLLVCAGYKTYRSFGRILGCELKDGLWVTRVMPLLHDNPNEPLLIRTTNETEIQEIVYWVKKSGISVKQELLPRDLDYLTGMYVTYIRDDVLRVSKIVPVNELELARRNKEILYSRFGLNSRKQEYKCRYCGSVHKSKQSWCPELSFKLSDVRFSFEDFV